MSTKVLQIIALLLFILAVIVLLLGITMVKLQPEPAVSPTNNQHSSDIDEVNSAIDTKPITESVSNQQSAPPSSLKETEQVLPPAFELSEGMRALAIPIDELSGIGGFVNPGNFVDLVYVSTKLNAAKNQVETQHILRNVRVLAFGNITQSSSVEQRVAKSAVLEVPAGVVIDLITAINMGRISLVLVGAQVDDADYGKVESILEDLQCLVVSVSGQEERPEIRQESCRKVDKNTARIVRVLE